MESSEVGSSIEVGMIPVDPTYPPPEVDRVFFIENAFDDAAAFRIVEDEEGAGVFEMF